MEKKKNAALAGVMYYLQEQQEELSLDELSHLPEHHTNPWVYYGRRTTARLGNLVQCRAFRTHRSSPNNTIPEKGRLLQRAQCLAVGMCRPVSHGSHARCRKHSPARKTSKE